MKEKIANSITQHQMTINELKKLQEIVINALDDKVEFTVKVSRLAGIPDLFIIKEKRKLDVTSYTMDLVIDELIKKEKERIDKLIDMEIERKISKNKKDN